MTRTYHGPRGLVGAPSLGRAPQAPPPERKRSGVVIIGMVGAAVFGGMALAKWRHDECRRVDPSNPESRPSSCESHGGSSHVFGSSSSRYGGGANVGHASFGGFGFSGFGHGGGS